MLDGFWFSLIQKSESSISDQQLDVPHLLPEGSLLVVSVSLWPLDTIMLLRCRVQHSVLINTYSPLCLRDNLSSPGVCRQFFKARLHARIVSLCTFGNYEDVPNFGLQIRKLRMLQFQSLCWNRADIMFVIGVNWGSFVLDLSMQFSSMNTVFSHTCY